MPDIFSELSEAMSAQDNARILHRLLPELIQMHDGGKIVEINKQFALAMGAGARAIDQNKQGIYGMTYVHDVFGDSEEIPYRVAADVLRNTSEATLKECEES